MVAGTFAIFGVIIFAVLLAIHLIGRWDDDTPVKMSKAVWLIPGGVIAIGLVIGSFAIIQAGDEGVVLRFGKVQSTMDSGLNFKMPFIDNVVTLSVKTQKFTDDATAASRDLQDVTASVALNYKLDPARVGEIYRTIGKDYINVIAHPVIQETVKEITAQYDAEDMILKRPEVKGKIETAIASRLEPRGIIAESINITNFAFSAEFTKSIEAKVAAYQRVLEARNKLEQIKVEAEQAQQRAMGEANALIANAEGQARSIKIVTEAQFNANKQIADSLNRDVLQYIMLDRLGKNVQVIVVPQGADFVIPSLSK